MFEEQLGKLGERLAREGAGPRPAGRLEAALERLDEWIEREGFRGWDPHDALRSRGLKRLSLGSRRLGIVWVQLFKRSPVNLRPLAGVGKTYNAKAMALFLASYLRKFQAGGQACHLERARYFAEWLREHVEPGYRGACWGYPFDWPNRSFYAPAGTPTLVNTAFAGLALLEAWQVGHWRLSPGLALETARSACDFLLGDLNRIQTQRDQVCFSYTPLDRRPVHNANLLAAWLLAEVHRRTGEPELARAALAAARYSARKQRPEGWWPYGEAPGDGWVDNFHTGFVLVALRRVAAALETDEFAGVLGRGYRYFKQRLIAPDGAPKYYPDRLHPVDAHAAAQTILTLLEFAQADREARAQAERVALWTIEHMQEPEGYFDYQIGRWGRIRIPYMRWSQAWMQRALTELAAAERPRAAPALRPEAHEQV